MPSYSLVSANIHSLSATSFLQHSSFWYPLHGVENLASMSENSILLLKNSTSLSEKLSLSFDVAIGGNLLEVVQVIQIMSGSHARHPPLSPAEISVTVAAVKAAGATPKVRDGMRFIEVSLVEPEKHVVALANAYFFPPFQPSLITRTKGGSIITRKLPPRQAKLTVYNRKSTETSIWVVEWIQHLYIYKISSERRYNITQALLLL